MKVLLLSNGFQPNYEKAFANGLAANGVEVELISSDRTLVNELDAGVQAFNLRGSQDPLRPTYIKALNLLRYAFVLGRYIRSGRHDVVHLTGLFMSRNVAAGVLEWTAYRLLARRFFMTVHNLLPHGRHGLFYRLLHHLIYRLPHRLVVHTEKMKAGLTEAFGVQGGSIIVMSHGADAVPAVLRVPPPSDTLRVLLFGGLNRYKGTDLLLSALTYCPELKVEVVIAGEARDAAYAQEIETLIAGLGKQHTARWDRGFIAEDQVAGYFESADVVALPYRHIDQSGVLFTAFRFGVPVIATDVGAFRECLPDFAGLIVDQPEPQALAQVVRDFYVRRQIFDRARIREHAQSLVWPSTVEPLITAYRKACA